MANRLRDAVRSSAIPLIGLYGLSGSGKTWSALHLGRGFVGPNGKLAVIDTEKGRAEAYAQDVPGGYQVLPLEAPFTPDAYIEAIDECEKSGVEFLVIDSGSHEWEGLGGVLDMAAASEMKSGKAGLHNWKKPKAAHLKFINRCMSSSIPILICLRAKYKSRQVYQNGKQRVVKDNKPTPIQAEDFIFEMTVHAEVISNTGERDDHTLRITKPGPADFAKVFLNGEKITMSTGERLRDWCDDVAKDKPTEKTKADTPVEDDPLYAIGKEKALQGNSVFSEWLEGLSSGQITTIKPKGAELRELARKTDSDADCDGRDE